MSEHRSFQVNLSGIIELLSGHLYSGPQVYVRELLQNGIDAITARRQLQPEHDGDIQLEIVSGDTTAPTLIVTDDGIGLTEDEVHQFLATIGQSSKRDSLNRDSFIGQFGIGMLSAFMVCDEIVLITKSLREESIPVKWTGRSDGTYTVEQLEQDVAPGSQVYLRCKPGCHDFFAPGFVERIARHYGSFLPVPIKVSANGGSSLINSRPPWQFEARTAQLYREELLDFGRDELECEFLDAIPLESVEGGVKGVAYVLPTPMNTAGRRSDHVYLKGMLVSKQLDNLLPDWAFFVQCVLNVTDLSPTASRESFHDDDQLEETRDNLGQALKNWLVDLARNDRARLDRIIALHYLPIKALAVDDDDFFEIVIEWLPFETTLGNMTMGEIIEHGPNIRYVSTRDQFRQISGVAASQGHCLINAGYVYDVEIMAKLDRMSSNLDVERVDASDLSQELSDLTLDEREEVMNFLRVADLALQPFRCQADIRKFDPLELPTLYTSSDEANFFRSVEQTKDVANELFSGVLDDIAEDASLSSWPQLCFNFRNPLIRRLAGLTDQELVKSSVEMIYVQSLLMGHYPLKSAEMKLLNTGLLQLIEKCVEGSE